ncbi:MAG: S1 family peptidase [Micrococcaceae bacterium]
MTNQKTNITKNQRKFIFIAVIFFTTLFSATPSFAFDQNAAGETTHSYGDTLKTAKLTLDGFNKSGEQAALATSRIKELQANPNFGGIWFDDNQLIIGATDPKDKQLNTIAKELGAKVKQTKYKDSDVQKIFKAIKDNIPNYSAVTYRYDNPNTMTIRLAIPAGVAADLAAIGDLPPNVEIKVVPMEDIAQLTTGMNDNISSELVESGNIYYTMQPNNLELTCSFAFPAIAPDGANVRISAGHCKEDGKNPAVKKNNSDTEINIGDYDKVVFNPDSKIHADASAIKLKDQTIPNPPTISTHDKDNTDIELTGLTNPIVGAPVCKSGSYTGVTCGKIIDIRSQNMKDGIYIDGFGTNLDSYPGDSGGGAFIGTKAVGIQSGSTVDKNTSKLLSTNFTSITTALEALPGYHLQTVNEPSQPVIAPIRDTWVKLGGKAVTGNTLSKQHKDKDATIQDFQNGTIVSSKSGTFYIPNNVKKQLEKEGGLSGKYGVPTNYATTEHDVTKQQFQKGEIKILNDDNNYWKTLIQENLVIIISGILLTVFIAFIAKYMVKRKSYSSI